MTRRSSTLAAAVLIVATMPLAQLVSGGVAGAADYTTGTPSLATITNGSSAAPWNEAQGDPSGSPYPQSDLLPSFLPGGPTAGSPAEPNVAVYPGAGSGTAGAAPYPSGVVGTPGPLAGYCGPGNTTTESSGSPVRQPAGTTLPLAPAYFPHIVRNSDGSLTGYFDYRPKDADEAIVVATSTDNGQDWTYQGEALEQNQGYCPSADINDDGEGHPNVITVGGTTYLYTLPRPAGDNNGVGMLVHTLTSTGANTLAGLPSSEQVGVDPDAFATAGASVPFTGGSPVTLSVNRTGTANSPEQLVPGPFVDLTQTPVPAASSIITCTGVGTNTLTGCTSANSGGATVATGDLVEQVIGTVSTAESIPQGPNNTLGTGGLASLPIKFEDNVTSTILNNNAPNRVYVNGVPVYCNQSNANQTTKLEDCTTGPAGSPLTATVGSPVTSDPVVPATAQQTNGLVAPDGIVGVLPSYPGAPAGSTIVLYTEKLLGYFMAGITNASGIYSSTTGTTITFFANGNTTATLGSPSPSSPVTVDVADDTKSSVIQATCTGLTVGSAGTAISSYASPLIDSLTGCTVPGADNGDAYATKDQIGGPGATLESPATLAKTGEGSTNQDKLYKNNEDLTILRAAYTTDGVNFSTTGLANGGVISGQGTEGANYDDINSPSTTADPPGGPNQYATQGTADATEMRWVGSAGTILTNTSGSAPVYQLFLSGAWGVDGDSDAFNQIFYATSTDGEHWSVPDSVISTDYTFSASAAQDADPSQALGISAYYSGRAYGPSVVPNGDGTLTMLFAGYRIPKTIANAGTVLGTNSSDLYTIGADDPALYRNILTVTLDPSVPNGGDTPEAPAVLLLPLSALAVGGVVLVVMRRRRRGLASG
jgi:hypothetical protein